jgi:hypothetical protein
VTTADHRRRRQRAGTALYRRLRYWLSRLSGARLQKSQRVYVVEMGGRRFKRLVLRDSWLARRIEETLESFGPSERVPALVMRYEHELWVEFIEGTPVARADEAFVRELAGLYAHLWARAPRRVPLAETPWPERLARDLRFLARVGVLARARADALARAAQARAPQAVWLGFDYTDPVLKNFVVAADDGRLCAVDVESLEAEQLIGTGAAKALLRWMEPQRKLFFDALAGQGAPDPSAELDWVELAFLAFYTKLMFLEQKWRNVEPERFERFL